MNLEKMLATQCNLDSRIIKEKGLEGKDLFPNTVLALQVELAEFANEGRWFKHWSNDQEPRIKVATGEYMTVNGGKEVALYKNLLLEEFVDAVHFFLSIANQKGWQDALYISSEPFAECDEKMQRVGKKKYLTDVYLEMIYFLMKSYMEINPEDKKIAGFHMNTYNFRLAWSLFMTIGIIGFDFTPEQIEEAYYKKNKINHDRQESGY